MEEKKFFQEERPLSTFHSDIKSIKTDYQETKTSFTVIEEIEDPDRGEVETWSREVSLEEPLNCFQVHIELKQPLRVGDMFINGNNIEVVFHCVSDYMLRGYMEIPLNFNVKWTNEFTLIGSAFQESNGN